MNRYIAALTVALSLSSVSAQASFFTFPPIHSVLSDGQKEYDFSGVCSDCNKYAPNKNSNAELILYNYVEGSAITNDNFVSFHYDGTDLLSGYSIFPQPAMPGLRYFGGEPLNYLSGAMPTASSAPAAFEVRSSTYFFSTDMNGNWKTGINMQSYDEGTGGSFSRAAAAPSSAVPEPGSAALLGLGLLGLVGLRRKSSGVR